MDNNSYNINNNDNRISTSTTSGSTSKLNICHKQVKSYFKEIIKNKQVIKDMYNTNIEIYEKKICENKEKIINLEELYKINKEKNIKEIEELNLELFKQEEELKKHQVNYKLLNKTKEHYKILIKERLNDIKKYKDKNIFLNQDITNRKLQINSLEAQIQEAEYQNKTLKDVLSNKTEELNKSLHEENMIFKESIFKGNKSNIININCEKIDNNINDKISPNKNTNNFVNILKTKLIDDKYDDLLKEDNNNNKDSYIHQFEISSIENSTISDGHYLNNKNNYKLDLSDNIQNKNLFIGKKTNRCLIF